MRLTSVRTRAGLWHRRNAAARGTRLAMEQSKILPSVVRGAGALPGDAGAGFFTASSRREPLVEENGRTCPSENDLHMRCRQRQGASHAIAQECGKQFVCRGSSGAV